MLEFETVPFVPKPILRLKKYAEFIAAFALLKDGEALKVALPEENKYYLQNSLYKTLKDAGHVVSSREINGAYYFFKRAEEKAPTTNKHIDLNEGD